MCSLVAELVQPWVEVVETAPVVAAEVKLTVTLGLASVQTSAVVARLATAAVAVEVVSLVVIVMVPAGVVVQAVFGAVVGSVATTAVAVVAAAAAISVATVIKRQRLAWSANEMPNDSLD